jgi:hypothetical protein
MFPEDAVFDVDWDDITPVCQERMVDVLTALTDETH